MDRDTMLSKKKTGKTQFSTLFSSLLVFALFLLVTFSQVMAKDIKVYDKNTLTIVELKKCVKLNDQISISSNRLKKDQKKVAKHLKKLKIAEKDAKEIKGYLDSNKKDNYTQMEADEYNSKLQEYDAKVLEYNELLEEHNKLQDRYNNKVNSHNKMAEKYKKDCTNKKYFDDDLREAKKSLKK